MANDSRLVISQLVRSGLWSIRADISKFKQFVVDVDSVVTYLYQLCLRRHLERQSSWLAQQKSNKSPDLYSATLVNYFEFAQCVRQLLDFFDGQAAELQLVYRGKYMEAPIFGLLPAQFKKNTQRASELLQALIDYDKMAAPLQLPSSASKFRDWPQRLRPWRPNLALNIFKMIVNARLRSGAKLQVHQAFYSPYPLLAKLARDGKCPVLTNDGDFILMDVRAGFVLFDHFWQAQIESNNICQPDLAPTTTTKTTNGVSPSSDRSQITLSTAKSLFAPKTRSLALRFNHSLAFVRQHPGLNPALALHLFPLTSGDFLVTHSKSLLRLKVYDTEFKEKDLVQATGMNQKQKTVSYHKASARLEMALNFLTSREPEVLSGIIRSEAARLKSSFDDDHRELFNYYSVAYEFKSRLKFVLRNLLDSTQLAHVEWCLLHRESTADYLLVLLTCALGRLASVSYNKSLQFEDLKTKRSAFSLLDHGKCLMMSLMSENKAYKGEHSKTLSSQQRQSISSKYSMASLTLIDRDGSKLVERTLSTTHEDAQVDPIRAKVTLDQLARRKVDKVDTMKLVNLAFKSHDLTRLSQAVMKTINKLLEQSEQPIRAQLAVFLNLVDFSFANASQGDDYFQRTYAPLAHHLKVAVLNHHLHMMKPQVPRNVKLGELKQLTDLIHKQDLENLASQTKQQQQLSKHTSQESLSSSSLLSVIPRNRPRNSSSKSRSKSRSKSKTKISASSTTKQQPTVASDTGKRVRHLLELLNSSLEAYCELNSFFDYPLPRLSIHLYYNPILLYNLTIYSLENPKDKVLLRF